jgi:hypothetical protein
MVRRRLPTVATAAAALLLNACAASGSLGNYVSSPLSAARPTASGGKLFVSDFYASKIVIYPAHQSNPAPTGEITSGVSYPYNLAVDDAGTLYVQNNNNTIAEYPKGASVPSKTLEEPPAGPGDLGTGICVTVGRDGTVYAADHYAGQVYEFAGASTTPTTTLHVSEAFGLALDKENDLYVGWSNSSSGAAGHVMEFKPGDTTGHDLGISVALSGGLAVDSDNHLLVGDQGNDVVDVFKRKASEPFRTIDTSPNAPYQFAFDHAGNNLYLVSGTPAEVYVYDYATGALGWTVTDGLPGSSGYAEGVAVRRAEKQ